MDSELSDDLCICDSLDEKGVAMGCRRIELVPLVLHDEKPVSKVLTDAESPISDVLGE